MDHIHRSDACTAPNMEWTMTTDNPINARGVTYSEICRRTQNNERLLESQFGIPRRNQQVIWTCQWQRLKTAPLDTLAADWEVKWAQMLRPWIARYDQLRPRERLVPRIALKGGKVENFLFSWTLKDAPAGEQLYYFDYNR